MANTYRCEICLGVFEKGWSEEDAAREAQSNFPGLDIENDSGLVCEDCYQQHIKAAQNMWSKC